MKKVMMLAMLMAVVVAAHAASPVTVVSGTKTFLRDNAKAVVTFSWDDAHWKEGGLTNPWGLPYNISGDQITTTSKIGLTFSAPLSKASHN